jgi:hypothetical protein
MFTERATMNIRYNNGYQIEGVLLSRNDTAMRVAIEGSEDVLHLNEIHGTWVTEDCEPVHVDFAWAKKEDLPVVTLDDCICSKELAAELLHLLFSGDEAAEAEAAALSATAAAPVYHQVV